MKAYVLEILWNRLLSIAEEQAQVLMRTAFSTNCSGSRRSVSLPFF